MTKPKLAAAVTVFVVLAGGGALAASLDTNAGLWATLESSSPYKTYARQNPNESARVKNYWLNGGSKPSVATKFGMFLVEVNEDRVVIPPPPPSGCALPAYPDASCTGVPAGTVLTPSGSLTINTAGTVIDGRDITGQVVVNAPNVTIRNSRIRGNAFTLVASNSTGLVVEDSELINQRVSGNNCHNAIAFGGYTVRRTEITGCENGADMGDGNVVFEDNYVHDLDTVGPSYVFGSNPHTDGVQIAFSANTTVVVRHNTIDPVGATVGVGATSAIIMDTSLNPNANVRIEDNYLDGRNSSVALYAPRQQTHDIYINRNHMYKGGFGNYTFCVKVGVTVTEFNGNVDAGTGAAIAPDNGVGGGCSN